MSMLSDEAELLHAARSAVDDLASRAGPTSAGAAELRDLLTHLLGDGSGTVAATAALAEKTEQITATAAQAFGDIDDALALVEALIHNTDYTPAGTPSSAGGGGAVEANFDVVQEQLAAMKGTTETALTAAGAAIDQANELLHTAVENFGGQLANRAQVLVELVEQITGTLQTVAAMLDEAVALAQRGQHGPGNSGTPSGPSRTQGAPPSRPSANPAKAPDARRHRRYSDEAEAVVESLGFDPYAGSGALADAFHAGTHECLPPDAPRREPHEYATAGLLSDLGADVRLTYESHDEHRIKSVDAWVRWTADDRGTATELKALTTATKPSKAVKDHLLGAAKQLKHAAGTNGPVAQGHVVIDGRAWGLTEGDARRGWDRAMGEANNHGRLVPAKTTIVLTDDSILVCRPTAVTDRAGRTVFRTRDAVAPRLIARHDDAWNGEWRTP